MLQVEMPPRQAYRYPLRLGKSAGLKLGMGGHPEKGAKHAFSASISEMLDYGKLVSLITIRSSSRLCEFVAAEGNVATFILEATAGSELPRLLITSILLQRSYER